MKLRNIIYTALAVTAATSCSDIAEDERLIEVEAATVERAVLVEEFSGQYCVNCPDGAAELESIQEQYGEDNVIIVSIHAGVSERLAMSSDGATVGGVYYQGLTTDYGEELYSQYGRPSEPSAVINRSSGVVYQSQWLTSVASALQEPSNLSLSLESEYDSESRQLTVSVSADATDDLSGYLQVWLTEDDIVSVQKLEVGYEYDHVFNNVFRSSLTSLTGDAVDLSWDGEVQEFTYTTTLGDLWVAENMSVVAFVYNSGGVCQTVKAKLQAGSVE